MNKLDHIMDRFGFSKIKKSASIGETLSRHWQVVFGEFATEVHFQFFKEGILYCEVKHATWVQELQYFKSTILDQANQVLGNRKYVRDLRFRVNSLFQVENQGSSAVEGKDLSEKIKNKESRLLEEGWVRCETCQKFLTQDLICWYCARYLK